MNLDMVKKDVMKEINISHTFFYRGMRNQSEEFEGRIIKCFPSVFIIETNGGVIKSFTYNDYVIRNIKIIS